MHRDAEFCLLIGFVHSAFTAKLQLYNAVVQFTTNQPSNG